MPELPVAAIRLRKTMYPTARPGRGPDQSQDQALGKQLTDQPALTGADGDAYCDLALPGHASRQQQAAQIAACHRQDQQARGPDQRENGYISALPSAPVPRRSPIIMLSA